MRSPSLCAPVPWIVFAAASGLLTRTGLAADTSRLQLQVRDEGGAPLPCQVFLQNDAGEPQRAPSLPFWNDHFATSGDVALDLPPGDYEYGIERGPEFERISGQLTLKPGKEQRIDVVLRRIAMIRGGPGPGWYSADLHVHRPPAEIETLLAAADLDFAPIITWWNQRDLWRDTELPVPVERTFGDNRYYHLMAGEDEREGGALLFFGLDRPLDITAKSREVPSPMTFVARAREADPDVWIDIEKPFWWDVPVWLASGQLNSIGIANNHQCRDRMYENEAWGRPRDTARLPAPLGNGYWSQEIYYHVLNTGLRVPPSAGSASGVLPNPVGYNRVYVHLDEEFTPERWFRGLAAGRCFVTNGPLLTCRANGQLAGAVFARDAAASHRIRLEIGLTSSDPVPKIEVIHNGAVYREIEPETPTESHDLELEFADDGWFLVRAITSNPRTFRFASTGPFYLQFAGKAPPVNRESSQFFLDWVDERIERVQANIADEAGRESVLAFHRHAREFWAQKVADGGPN